MALAKDTTLIKTAHKTQKFTEQDIIDLQECNNQSNGHKYFLKKFFAIQHPTRGQIQYEAYGYQDALVDSLHNFRFNVNMLPRQSGKTTTAVGYLLWYAVAINECGGFRFSAQKICEKAVVGQDHIVWFMVMC